MGDAKSAVDGLAAQLGAASLGAGGGGGGDIERNTNSSDARRQESTLRAFNPADEESRRLSKALDHNKLPAKQLGNGNTTSLVGGLTLTDADAKSQDRKKFFHGSVQDGDEVVADDQDKFVVFMRWLQQHGAALPGLYLKKYTDDVRGVHADQEIGPNSQIVTIPLKLLIHEGMGQKTATGARVHADPTCHIIVPAHTQVIIYILENLKNPDCFFKPYFDILPDSFNRCVLLLSGGSRFWSSLARRPPLPPPPPSLLLLPLR
jgi:hypothetical protein